MRAVAGWPVAFRGTAALAAGLVTPDVLRGPRFLRLFPDTYVAVPDELPPDLALRSHAAYRYVEHAGGVLSGHSAAELLGASCGPRDAPAEVTVPHRGRRTVPGLLVHRTRLAPGETTETNGLRVTSPVRTAYDLARRGDLVERIVAVDRLSGVHHFPPDLLLHFTARNPRARGNHLVPEALTHADRRAASPMETGCACSSSKPGCPAPKSNGPSRTSTPAPPSGSTSPGPTTPSSPGPWHARRRRQRGSRRLSTPLTSISCVWIVVRPAPAGRGGRRRGRGTPAPSTPGCRPASARARRGSGRGRGRSPGSS